MMYEDNGLKRPTKKEINMTRLPETKPEKTSTRLLTQNNKMKKSININGKKYRVFNFGIPAYKSKDGSMTCPLAGKCATGCYAQQGAYVWSNVAQAFEKRYQLTKTDEFKERMRKEIKTKVKTAMNRKETLVIRIHDSGDFYSLDYILKWIDIILEFSGVHFYAYTKMLPTFKRMEERLPDNFTLIYSEGGKADDMIDTNTMRHSRVFSSHEELERAGYADASSNDLVAALGDNHRIGLVYHGANSKAWTTE